jgi:Mg2+ and Co2+ transporter CorA
MTLGRREHLGLTLGGLAGENPRSDPRGEVMATATAHSVGATAVRRCSLWRPGDPPVDVEASDSSTVDGVLWFDVAGSPEAAPKLLEQLRPSCPGITLEMLADLLEPDPEPEGAPYDDGSIRLASSFSVKAKRAKRKAARGSAQRAGVLIFQPVELLAADGWLVTCWHPTQPFAGSERAEPGERGTSDEVFGKAAARWAGGSARTGGDLGTLVMRELALSYKPAVRGLEGWLEDWELSLYVEDDLSNPDELSRLWGEMAVLRDWLKALNRPGLRADADIAWLPVGDPRLVIDVDDLVDKALDLLRSLAQTLRSSFGVLHVQLAEEERERREGIQRRVELAAAIFLVPTLIVGFYGANTWVPGQQRHWGFWVMVAILVAASVAVVVGLLRWHSRQAAEAERDLAERRRQHAELVRELTA